MAFYGWSKNWQWKWKWKWKWTKCVGKSNELTASLEKSKYNDSSTNKQIFQNIREDRVERERVETVEKDREIWQKMPQNEEGTFWKGMCVHLGNVRSARIPWTLLACPGRQRRHPSSGRGGESFPQEFPSYSKTLQQFARNLREIREKHWKLSS